MLFWQNCFMNQITVAEVKEALDKKEEVVILDVRSQEEVERGKIDGSIHLPMDEIVSKVNSVIPDKNSKVIIYCLSGSRSFIAAEFLENLGYKNVFDMANGLLAWRAKGYPLV